MDVAVRMPACLPACLLAWLNTCAPTYQNKTNIKSYVYIYIYIYICIHTETLKETKKHTTIRSGRDVWMPFWHIAFRLRTWTLSLTVFSLWCKATLDSSFVLKCPLKAKPTWGCLCRLHFNGLSVQIGTMRRRLAWPLCKDDMHTSKIVNKVVFVVCISFGRAADVKAASVTHLPECTWPSVGATQLDPTPSNYV